MLNKFTHVTAGDFRRESNFRINQRSMKTKRNYHTFCVVLFKKNCVSFDAEINYPFFFYFYSISAIRVYYSREVKTKQYHRQRMINLQHLIFSHSLCEITIVSPTKRMKTYVRHRRNYSKRSQMKQKNLKQDIPWIRQ